MKKCYCKIPLVVMLVLIAIGCTEHARIPGDWDIYKELNTDMLIQDNGGAGLGVDFSDSPDNMIDSIAIEVCLEHERPADLDIWLKFGTDSMLLWDNDYPGGTQIISVDTLVGTLTNIMWNVDCMDYVVNGKEGRLKRITLMIRY